MIKKRAFILTEILTGLILKTGFILVLCGAFYMTFNFYIRSTKILAAREKGQRVISFVDQRIRHTGLGLWKCKSSAIIRDSLNQITVLNEKLTNEAGGSDKEMHLPVIITSGDTWKQLSTNLTLNAWNSLKTYETGNENSGKIKGNILTLLYAQKVRGKILIINNKLENDEYEPYGPYALSHDIKSIEVNLITAKGADPGKNTKDKNYESFFDTKTPLFNKVGTPSYITSWSVTATAGVPLLLKKPDSDTRQILISVSADVLEEPIYITSGTELLQLKCDRMYVEGDISERDTGRNFAFKKLQQTWGHDAEKKRNYVPGILEIYMELDKKTHVLDFYVLASGGRDLSLNTARPKAWPKDAAWNNNEYKHHYIYVSRKSWYLDNIPEDFIWN